MSPKDLRLFCTALGFTAIVMKGDEQAPDSARRAMAFATLIEAFCTQSQEPSDLPAAADSPSVDLMIDRLKSDLRDKGDADLHMDRERLQQLYTRLQQRYMTYASDDDIADRALELLDAELNYQSDRSIIS